MTISTRVTLSFFAASLLSVILAAYFFFNASAEVVERQYRDVLRDASAMLILQAQPWLSDATVNIDKAVDATAAGIDFRLTVIGTDGVVLGDSQRSGADLRAMENHGHRPEVLMSMQNEFGSDVRTSATLGIRFLYVARSIAKDGRVLGTLRLAAPMSSVRELEQVRTRYMGAATAAILAASLLLAAVLGTWFRRPMSRLKQAAAAIASGHYDAPIGPLGNDEIGELGNSVQQMAESLDATITRLNADRQTQETVLGSLREGVIAMDQEGNVILANRATQSQLGEETPLVSRDVFEFFRQPNATALLMAVLNDGEGGTTEITLDGPPARVLQLSALPVSGGSGNLAALLVITDITTYVTTLRMRRDFFSNASHELRTPLTSIIGYLENLEDSLPADSPLKAQYLGVLTRQSERMRRIIDDLLMLAQVESEQWPVHTESYDLAAQAAQVIESFRPTAGKYDQDLHLTASVAVVRVEADREKIHVVLSNLMDNAVKYAGEGGRVELDLTVKGDHVEVTVSDNGPGIPRAETQRVFERFYRLDKSRSRQLGGTGLGLSIVRNILAAHEVEITLDSDLGEGARFSFALHLATD